MLTNESRAWLYLCLKSLEPRGQSWRLQLANLLSGPEQVPELQVLSSVLTPPPQVLEQAEGGPQSPQSPLSASSLLNSKLSCPACLLVLATARSYRGGWAGWNQRMKPSYSSLLSS